MLKHTILISWLALGLLGAMAAPARAGKHADVTAELNTTNLQPGQQAVVAVVLDVKEGFHAQSHKPLDPNFVPLMVKVDAPAGTTAQEPIYPEGVIHDYPALGKLNIYTGRVIVYVPIQIKPDAAAGAVKISGTVKFQACDDSVCYMPEKMEFTIDTTIVAKGEPQTPNQPELFKGFDPAVKTDGGKP